MFLASDLRIRNEKIEKFRGTNLGKLKKFCSKRKERTSFQGEVSRPQNFAVERQSSSQKKSLERDKQVNRSSDSKIRKSFNKNLKTQIYFLQKSIIVVSKMFINIIIGVFPIQMDHNV